MLSSSNHKLLLFSDRTALTPLLVAFKLQPPLGRFRNKSAAALISLWSEALQRIYTFSQHATGPQELLANVQRAWR
jgi:hypothetical protein